METKNNQTSILVVDDEADIREILLFNLENEGYKVGEAESSEIALEKLTTHYDLILLDVMMSGMSGYKMADQLRKSGNNTPIIFLTAKDSENDMLTGFSIGADDYISKPFSIKEVIARIKSVLKRSANNLLYEAESHIFKIEDLQIDQRMKTVKINNRVIDLTKTEFNILVLLITNIGTTFSRSDILEKAWSGEGIVLDRTVDVHIARLRKKLDKYGDCIVNRSGYGYNFQFPV